MIKKDKKNKIKLEPNFYDIYFNNNNIIQLNEEIKKDKINNNESKINKLNKEINLVDNLIKISNEKLLSIQKELNDDNINNINNKVNSIGLTYKDLLQLNNDNNKNCDYILAKCEGGLKIELAHINDPKNIMNQKRIDMNIGKLQYNDEYLNLCSFSNRLYLTSKNNSPIILTKIGEKRINNIKEKEEIENFQINNENENTLNNNELINTNINENYNFGLFKNNNNDNKFRKDSLISDYSLFCNSFNGELVNTMNNGII